MIRSLRRVKPLYYFIDTSPGLSLWVPFTLVILPPRWLWLAILTRKDPMLLEHVGQHYLWSQSFWCRWRTFSHKNHPQKHKFETWSTWWYFFHWAKKVSGLPKSKKIEQKYQKKETKSIEYGIFYCNHFGWQFRVHTKECQTPIIWPY